MRGLTERQQWVVIGVGWAWLVSEFIGAAALLVWVTGQVNTSTGHFEN
jgi:hypothetical protein